MTSETDGSHADGMQYVTSPIELIGDTPMMRLGPTVQGARCTVLAKCEWMNPGGSSKDRPALAMIDDAEARGLLAPGGTIVEPTSGNTGVGLAMVAARRGYRCVFVVPDKVSEEKFALLRAHGAEVIACPTDVEPEDPRSYYSVAARLVSEIPGAWQPDQYHNPANPAAHEATTGPEIWRQTAGRVTHFVVGAGTGGTVTGVARYLKAQNPDVKVIVADPEGSVYSGSDARPYLVEGVGEDFWPANYEPDLIDEVVVVSDGDAFRTARQAARTEGILIGGSSGMVLAAAARVAKTLPADAVVVVLFPDTGRNYLSRIFSDPWMVRHGFLSPEQPGKVDAKTLVEGSRGGLPVLVYTRPEQTVTKALELMSRFGVSQLPVLTADLPVVVSEVVGIVERDHLEALIAADPSAGEDPVSDHLGPKPDYVGAYEPLDAFAGRVRTGPLVVLEEGRATGVITEADIAEENPEVA